MKNEINEELKTIEYNLKNNISLELSEIKIGIDNIFNDIVNNIKDRLYQTDCCINKCNDDIKREYNAYTYQYDNDREILYEKMNNIITQFINIKDYNNGMCLAKKNPFIHNDNTYYNVNCYFKNYCDHCKIGCPY